MGTENILRRDAAKLPLWLFPRMLLQQPCKRHSEPFDPSKKSLVAAVERLDKSILFARKLGLRSKLGPVRRVQRVHHACLLLQPTVSRTRVPNPFKKVLTGSPSLFLLSKFFSAFFDLFIISEGFPLSHLDDAIMSTSPNPVTESTGAASVAAPVSGPADGPIAIVGNPSLWRMALVKSSMC